VAKFIPAFANQKVYVSGEGEKMVLAPAKRQVQVRNLLMHTSGYSYGGGNAAPATLYRSVLPRDKPLAEFCAAAATLPLQFEPGTQWQYGISTDILGHVVELASGRSLPEFLQERILGPLGMDDTAFFVAPAKAARLTNTYAVKEGKLEVVDDAKTSRFLAPPVMASGGGGLTSTTDDYLRFAAMLLNEGELDGVRILGPQTVRLMRSNQLPPVLTAARDSGFGLGFGVDLEGADRDYYGGHGSFFWSGAQRTHFWVDPVYKIVGLSMTQVDPFNEKFEEDMRALTYQAFMG
jgi:CubicO group peptidase (beta-lactamase class C family)